MATRLSLLWDDVSSDATDVGGRERRASFVTGARSFKDLTQVAELKRQEELRYVELRRAANVAMMDAASAPYAFGDSRTLADAAASPWRLQLPGSQQVRAEMIRTELQKKRAEDLADEAYARAATTNAAARVKSPPRQAPRGVREEEEDLAGLLRDLRMNRNRD